MPFKRFVETGRVVYISNGPYAGKLSSIVDVIDETRVLIDGPNTGVPRIGVRLNEIRLTKFKLKVPFTASTRVVRKSWSVSNIDEKWKDTLWAKHLASKRSRRNLGDFDRFRLRNARRIRNVIRSVAYHKLAKDDRRKREKLRQDNKGRKGYNRRVRKVKK